MTLITQADVEKHLQIVFGTDPDPVVADLIAQSQAAAEAYCRQLLEHATVGETFEADQPEAWHVLDRFPVTAVVSVVEDATTLTETTDYRWYPDGRLRRVAGTREQTWSTNVDAVVVTYTAGYGTGAPAPFTTVPDDLILAITTICGELFNVGAANAQNGPIPVKQVQLDGSDTVAYAVDSVTASAAVPYLSAKVKQLLAPYVRRSM